VTRVEDSALESAQAFSVWATILFSVAIRIERLKYYSRKHPEAPATLEFSGAELAALLLLRKRAVRAPLPDAPLNIATAVRWVADLGGYMNPHQGPPGSTVIARGLRRLRQFAEGFHHGN
jgi:hypothetical protein